VPPTNPLCAREVSVPAQLVPTYLAAGSTLGPCDSACQLSIVSFSYFNTNSCPVTLPAGSATNIVFGSAVASSDQGQPSLFTPGITASAFTIVLPTNATVTWEVATPGIGTQCVTVTGSSFSECLAPCVTEPCFGSCISCAQGAMLRNLLRLDSCANGPVFAAAVAEAVADCDASLGCSADCCTQDECLFGEVTTLALNATLASSTECVFEALTNLSSLPSSAAIDAELLAAAEQLVVANVSCTLDCGGFGGCPPPLTVCLDETCFEPCECNVSRSFLNATGASLTSMCVPATLCPGQFDPGALATCEAACMVGTVPPGSCASACIFLCLNVTCPAVASCLTTALIGFSPTRPFLGTAVTYGVLAGSSITNTGITIINGDVGLSPGSALTGAPIVTGATNVDDPPAVQAKLDLTAAYNEVAGMACGTVITTDLGGLTLEPGVYCFSSSAGLTGTLTLDAGFDTNAAFIFQIPSALTTASGSLVTVINGLPCGVFWQVGSSATLGTGSTFLGTILALASITANTGVVVPSGQLLTQTSAVTMDANVMTIPACTQSFQASCVTPCLGPCSTSAPPPPSLPAWPLARLR
jgi:hypothetical protein